jgi:hypothetical protein
LTVAGAYPTSTTLASSGSPDSSTSPNLYTLTATVGGSGATAPTGNVSFSDTSNGNYALATAPLVANAPSLNLINSSNPATGPFSGTLAVGDFNNDGIADIAVTSLNSNDVSILLGTGDGTFNPVASPATGNYPIAVAVGDLNGDGNPDLATANLEDNTISILLGHGDGTFTAAANVTGTTSPVALVLADFNGDGWLDLAVAEGGGGISVMLGNGDGTFTAGEGSTVTATNLAVGDFNGDGKADLAVSNLLGGANADYTGTLTILLGNGDGSFTAVTAMPQTAGGPGPLVVGDFNGDGKADIAVTGITYIPDGALDVGVITVLLGNGDGTFLAAASVVLSGGENPDALAIGDFNGDGKADLAVLVTANDVDVLLGAGDGTFALGADFGAQNPSLAENIAFSGLAVGNFNDDGNSDMALSTYSRTGSPVYSTAAILLSQTQTSTATATNISPSGLGTHIIEARYFGDTEDNASTSSTLGILIFPATTLTLTATPSASTGGPVTLTATLSPYNSQGHTTDGETVTFFDGATSLGTGTLTGGVAVLNTTITTGGSNQLTATYNGDQTFAGSTSNTFLFTVAVAPSITFAVPNHTYGDPPFSVAATSNSSGAFTYSVVSGPATFSGSIVTITGTGTVALQVSEAATSAYLAATAAATFVISQATLSYTVNSAARVYGAANPNFTGTITGAVYGDTFTETFTTTATTASIVGTYPIVAAVNGAKLASYNLNGSDGSLTVSQAGTATTFALSNNNTTFTAMVSSLTSGVPTGSVSFYEGQTVVGIGSLTNGAASYTAPSAPAGDVLLSAQYSGDANFTQSASPPVLMVSVVPASASLTVTQGQSVSDTLSISPAPGYSGTVQFSCTSLPANSACSFQPTSVAFTGSNTPASISVTFQTSGPAQIARFTWPGAALGRLIEAMGLLFWLPGSLAAIVAGRSRRAASRRKGQLTRGLLVCAVFLMLNSCGGGSSPAPVSTSMTPKGSYTVDVIATGPASITETTGINLIVQ